MSSKREEERNEKIIRGLLKLPPNRRCINCNSLGPQYVCANFWTFVCTACSGIHREFTHRVKSISMAKFTAQEADALQNGGNQRARELFLKDWDMQSMRFPDSSYPDKIRAFIKNVYVDKKYAGERSSDKPPRDPQGLKTHEEYRRASSYHSFSQSPPYDHQYEERRYGRPKIMLTRKPGSDNGHYEGHTSSILYSPGRDQEQTYEDRFANESSGPRISDYSLSSAGDPIRSGGQSPNTYSSPSKPRSALSGSYGTKSFDGKLLDPKSANSGALSDMIFEPKHTSISPKANKSTVASSEMSTPQDSASNDLFCLQNLQQHIKTSVDFFADFSNQPSFLPTAENKPSSVPPSENEGWAMFDLVHHVAPVLEVNKGLSSGEPPHVEGSIEIIDAFSSNPESSQWFLAQDSAAHGGSAPATDQWHADFDEIQNAADSMSHPVWNAFDDSFERNSSNLHESSSQDSQIFVNKPSISGGYYTGVVVPKVLNEENLQMPVVLDNAPQIKNASGSQHSASLSCEVRTAQQWKSTNPFDLPYDLDPGTSNMFNISSLQGALPNAQLPNAFLDGLSQPWFPQNSASTFIPSIPKGLSHMGGHSPSSESPNVTSQGSVATGNPFA